MSAKRLIIRFFLPQKLRSITAEFLRRKNRFKRRATINLSQQISWLTQNVKIVQQPIISDSAKPVGFEILIPCSKNHFQYLEANIRNLVFLYGKNVKIRVIHPDDTIFSQLKGEVTENVYFVKQEKIIQELNLLLPTINKYNPERRKWLLQQCLKTYIVHTSTRPVLIIDADTFLCCAIDFYAEGKPYLLIGSKSHSHYHSPYSEHIYKFLGAKSLPINFVHHVQLQIPEKVREIYSSDVLRGLNRWLDLGSKFREFSAVSEFQTYGEFMLLNYPQEITLFDHIHRLEKIDRTASSCKELACRNIDLNLRLNKFNSEKFHLLTFF